MAMAIPRTGLYRRILPSPPSIDFFSSHGKQLFIESVQNGTMEGFFKLISNFQTQSELTYCGLASLSMTLNALDIDPGRKWKGPWRWFDESMLDICEPLEKVKARGISLEKLVSLAHCAGAKVQAFRTNQSTIDDFRKYILRCSSSDDCHIILSYYRATFKQTGAGHYSPLGGYHVGKDMALILDVARFKYPPHWVPLKLLWEAMESVIEGTGQHRGFMLISRPDKEPGVLYTPPWTGLYRRKLPSPPSIDLSSSQGKQLFAEAAQNGTMECFYKLISNFQTQSELSSCGLASLSMALNALAFDPGRKWKGPWRWFDESMFDICEPLEKVNPRGISLENLVSLAQCAGAKVQAFRTNQSRIDDFRKYIIRCSTSDDCHIILYYHRATFKQTGAGHYSPIGGYHVGTDMVLILDVARFKYRPHWVPLKLLWEAMESVNEATRQHRGFMLISKPDRESRVLYTPRRLRDASL